MTETILNKIQELAPMIGELKTNYGLISSEIEALSKVIKPKGFQKAILNKLMSNQKHLATKDWIKQADLDCFLLIDRIK